MLDVLVSVNKFILFFLSLCSVLVYHEYINANIFSQSILPPILLLSYLPTPPLGQDRTQGQFLSGV